MDLPDGVLQTLYATGLGLEAALEDVDADPAAATSGVERAIARLHGTISDIRHYIFGLRAAQQEGGYSLPAMLKQLLDGFQHPGVELSLDAADTAATERNVSKRVQWECWHVAREAVANALRHSGCRRVAVTLRLAGRDLQLRVDNDGVGFDTSTPARQGHRGLRNMQRRAESVGGRLRVESAPGSGTAVTFSVPLPAEGGARMIRVLLVDDHDVVREGLRSLLRRSPDIEVVGEAGTAAAAEAEAARLQPDVVVLDVRLPDGNGVEVCRDIRAHRPETRVLMLTSYADDEALFASIMAGAAGYLLKETRAAALLEAIHTAARGGSLLDPAMTQRVFERLRAAATGPVDPMSQLSEQEQRILGLIAEGKTNKEIAVEVYLSDKTVKHYVSNILSKLQLSRRSEAAAFWARHRRRAEET